MRGLVIVPRKVTINMVAERAGVSRGTVDRVLNQRPHVKPELYERIVRAMKELGYVPPKEEQAIALGLPSAQIRPCKIGVLLSNENGYIKSEFLRGIADASHLLQDYMVDVLVEECETAMQDECVERIEDLVSRGAQGISLFTMNSERIVAKINELHGRNIPVVTFNSDIPDSERLCFVGQPVVRSGRIAGELMSKCIGTEDTLLITLGNPEFHAHRLRLQGFCERIYERGFSGGNLKIIETYNDYSLTNQKIRQALTDDPTIKGIYMANQSVTGCVQAVRDVGMTGKVSIICHDLTDATKRLLRMGEIDFAITQDLYQQGYRPLILLREYLQKNIKPDCDRYYSSISVMCSENLDC